MKIKNLTRTSILIAIIYISMALLHITLFGSVLHLGSLVIVIVSLTFPKKESAIASAIGPTLFDILSGYAIYAPFTLVSRLALSLIVSSSKNKGLPFQIIAAIIGGTVVIAVYFISYLIFLPSINEALFASVPDIIQLILTVTGVFIAIPLRKVVSNAIKA